MKLTEGRRPWTVLTVTDKRSGEVHAVYNVDGTGEDEQRWLYRMAFRDNYRSPLYHLTFTTEMRNDDE